jgi:hypothetical protein
MQATGRTDAALPGEAALNASPGEGRRATPPCITVCIHDAALPSGDAALHCAQAWCLVHQACAQACTGRPADPVCTSRDTSLTAE